MVHPSSNSNLFCYFRLSKFQLIFSIIIIVLHIVTTGLDDHFLHKKAHFDNTKRFEHFFSYDGMADHAATGIWVGLLVGYNDCGKTLIFNEASSLYDLQSIFFFL